MATKLFIDDERFPPSDDNFWIIVRTSNEAIAYCKTHGVPEFISFDHDLGGDDTSMIFIKWMIEIDLDSSGNFIPTNFEYYVHSQNVNGRDNINGLLESYLNHRRNP